MILLLKKDIEKTNNDGSKTVYPSDQFGIAAVATIDAAAQTVRVVASVRNLNTKKASFTFFDEIYDATGRNGEVTNQTAVETYLTQKATIKSEITQARTDVISQRNTVYNSNDDSKSEELTKLEEIEQIKVQKETDFANLQKVTPVYETIDTYAEIKDYFSVGALTSEGVAWFKKQAFQGTTIDEYIQL